MLLRQTLEGSGDDRTWCTEQRGKEVVGIDVALTGGTDHAGEDFLGLRAAWGSIAATDLAVDDGRAHRVFGSPAGRVDPGIPQEREHGREFQGEMIRKARRVGQSGRGLDEPAEARQQVPARDGETLIGDRARIAPVAKREGVREHGLHAGGPGAAWMIEAQRATPADQMSKTRLMQGLGEPAIRRPPVTHQDAIEVLAQYRGRVGTASTGTDGVHGGVRRRKRPEPVQHRAMQHGHQTTRGHRHPEARAQQRRDLLQRHPVVFVQQDDEGHRLGTEVDTGRAQRIRRLQRMPALRAAATRDAAPPATSKRRTIGRTTGRSS